MILCQAPGTLVSCDQGAICHVWSYKDQLPVRKLDCSLKSSPGRLGSIGHPHLVKYKKQRCLVVYPIAMHPESQSEGMVMSVSGELSLFNLHNLLPKRLLF